MMRRVGLVRALGGTAAALGLAGGLASCNERSLDGTPMMANQGKLQRLPLPSLDATLDRYLAALAPIVSKEALERTRAIVAESLAAGSSLRALHSELEAKEASGQGVSFISDFCEAPLGPRTPRRSTPLGPRALAL